MASSSETFIRKLVLQIAKCTVHKKGRDFLCNHATVLHGVKGFFSNRNAVTDVFQQFINLLDAVYPRVSPSQLKGSILRLWFGLGAPHSRAAPKALYLQLCQASGCTQKPRDSFGSCFHTHFCLPCTDSTGSAWLYVHSLHMAGTSVPNRPQLFILYLIQCKMAKKKSD